MVLRRFIYSILFMLSTTVVLGQKYNAEKLAQLFESYHDQIQSPKVLLVLSQYKAIKNDTIFFTAFALNEEKQIVSESLLTFLDLIDADGKSLKRVNFRMEGGKAHNQLIIPNNITPGTFRIIARVNGDQSKAYDYEQIITIVEDKKQISQSNIAFKVLPEGGTLVSNLENKIGIVSPWGESTMILITDLGDTLQTFRTDKNGNAAFILRPSLKRNYTLKTVGSSESILLPTVQKEGLVMQLTQGSKGVPIRIKIAAPHESTLAHQNIAMLVTTGGKIVVKADLEKNNKEFIIAQIPTNQLKTGLYKASFMAENGMQLAYRDFYFSNESDTKVSITGLKDSYHIRDKVAFNLNVDSETIESQQAIYSVRVYKETTFDEPLQFYTKDKIWLSGFSNVAIDREQPNWAYSLDHALIAQSTPMDWKAILNNNGRTLNYYNSPLVTKKGKVIFTETNEPVPANSRLVIFLQNEMSSYLTFVGDSGEIELEMSLPTKDEKLMYFLKSGDLETGKVTVLWENDNVDYPMVSKSIESHELDNYGLLSNSLREISISYNFFATTNSEIVPQSSKENPMLTQLKEEADVSVNVQDFIRFKSMEELIREIVKSLSTSKKDDTFQVRVTFAVAPPSDNNPLYFIDGTATTDTNFFMNMSPGEINTISVIRDRKKLANFGLLGRNGIVIVDTKRGNVTLPSAMPSYTLQGLSNPLLPNFKRYDDGGIKHFPDFRTNLYWNYGRINSKELKKIDFYCSDDIGYYIIRIEGLSSTGEAFTLIERFKVELGEKGG